MLTHDDIADLTWFFQRADGDCGLRSALGPQLEVVGQQYVRHDRGDLTYAYVKKPLRNMYRDNIPEQQLLAAERANQIGARLHMLTREERIVLELQYGDPTQIEGIGVSLLSATKAAFGAWHKARRYPRKKEKNMLFSIRAWLLVTLKRSKKLDAIQSILSDGQAALDGAHAAYAGAEGAINVESA